MTNIDSTSDAAISCADEEATVTSGILTLEKWTAFVRRDGVTDNSISQGYASHDFQNIAKSEFLIQNFLSFPYAVQRNVSMLIRNNVSPIETGCALRLKLKLHEPHPGMRGWPSKGLPDWFAIRNVDLMQIVDGEPLHLRDKTFFNLVETMSDERYWVGESQIPSIIHNQKLTIAYLLAVIHGKERVQEVMESWINNPVPHSIEDFVRLTERWDEFKDYPIDWAVSLVNKELREQVVEGDSE